MGEDKCFGRVIARLSQIRNLKNSPHVLLKWTRFFLNVHKGVNTGVFPLFKLCPLTCNTSRQSF
jgi:hypothetical protein